ncbi:MAG: 4Fe-4S binding protein, partial [Clostridium celatum]|nr:4Fe-4S binding protein [Clostridium celatum]
TQAILSGADIYGKITNELNEFLDAHGYLDVKEIISLAHRKSIERNVRTTAICPSVDYSKCVRCGKCKKSCVYEAIDIKDKLKIDENKCFGCGLCVTRCPRGALKIQYK